jgi:hypothetical protein
MGAAVLSAGDRAGKPDGPPIADETQSPARDRFGSCLGSAHTVSLICLKNNSLSGGRFGAFLLALDPARSKDPRAKEIFFDVC